MCNADMVCIEHGEGTGASRPHGGCHVVGGSLRSIPVILQNLVLRLVRYATCSFRSRSASRLEETKVKNMPKRSFVPRVRHKPFKASLASQPPSQPCGEPWE